MIADVILVLVALRLLVAVLRSMLRLGRDVVRTFEKNFSTNRLEFGLS